MERRLLMVPKEVMPETNEMNIKRNDISFILAWLIKEVFFASLKSYFYCSACLRLRGIAFLFRGFSILFLYQSYSMLLILLSCTESGHVTYKECILCMSNGDSVQLKYLEL